MKERGGGGGREYWNADEKTGVGGGGWKADGVDGQMDR